MNSTDGGSAALLNIPDDEPRNKGSNRQKDQCRNPCDLVSRPKPTVSRCQGNGPNQKRKINNEDEQHHHMRH